MVTCQPVNATEIDRKTQNNIFNADSINHDTAESVTKSVQRQTSQQEEKSALTLKPLEYESSGGIFCCTSDIAPMKIMIPNQETVLLTGVLPSSQLLIHKKEVETQSGNDQKFLPLHSRIFTSSGDQDLDQINSVTLKSDSHNGTKQDKSGTNDFTRSDSFKEERSIPMKKRLIVDQHEQNNAQSFTPPVCSSHSHSPPSLISNSTTQRYIQQPNYMKLSHSVSQPIPELRPRYGDSWGYMPLQKRQKFGVQGTASREEGPLDLIKQS